MRTLQFALLGIGAGAAYAILATGVVVVFRGTGILNFAQGAIGTFCAYLFFELHERRSWPLAAAFAAVLVLGVVIGAAMHLLLMRPLRRTGLLAKVVATLALVVLLEALVVWIFGGGVRIPSSVLPVRVVEVLGVRVGLDRLYLGGIAVAVAGVTALLVGRTRTGLVMRAMSDNERGAQLLGFSPDVVAVQTWAFGSALAALAGILVTPMVGMDPLALTLMIVPVFTAALIGRFSSIVVTTVAAFAIGMVQSVITSYGGTTGRGIAFLWQGQGRADAFPAVVVILAMIAFGRLLPGREGSRARWTPRSPSPRRVLVPAAAALLVGAPVLALATATWTRAATISILMAVVALSLVVVTGYVGQVSLVHMAFVGVAAFVVSKLSSDLGWPFPLPIVAGALLATTLGLVLGLPSVRVRGPSLAIVTLAAALALDRVLFQNPSVTGRFEGSRVAAPSLFGWELGPRWFAILSLGALVLIASLVANLRRSALGRRFIAVRENERAAAAAGIGVAQTKLTGFAASAFVAGLAGGLLAYHLRIIGFERFGPIASLHVVLQAYLGGIGMISGAVVAGLLANGGVFSNVVSRITAIESFESVLMAVLLLVTLTTHPDGIASLLRDRVGHVRSSRPRPHPGGVGTATSSGPASTRRPSAMDDQSEGRSHAHT